MTRMDFSPYRRTMVGFDRLFDALENANSRQGSDNYPPFNIEKIDDDRFQITLAVAGFKTGEIDITAQQNLLLVSGQKQAADEEKSHFIHLGIATRNFERRFELADFVRVEGADLSDGMLVIDLVREVPEAMKPQSIAINSRSQNVVEDKSDEIEREAA